MSIMLAFVLFALRFPSCLLINAWFLSHSAFYTHYLNEMSHIIFQFMQLENGFIAFIIALNCQWCMMYGSFDSLDWRHWLIMLLYSRLWFCQSGCLGHNLPLLTENIPFSTLSFCIKRGCLYLTYQTQHVYGWCSLSRKTVASVAKVRRIVSTFLLPAKVVVTTVHLFTLSSIWRTASSIWNQAVEITEA